MQSLEWKEPSPCQMAWIFGEIIDVELQEEALGSVEVIKQKGISTRKKSKHGLKEVWLK